MPRLPAALLVACLLLAGCSVDIVPPSVAPSATATPTPTIPPPRSQEPFPLLSVEFVGGECPPGACHRLINLEADGTLRLVIPETRVVGTVPKPLLDALQVEMDQANFALIESRPFTGECPTAVDGQELIYTFHLVTGDEKIRSCSVATDPDHPLFRAVGAVLARISA
jgi:hypothetical protein